MELIEVLQGRRAIRDFTDEPVDRTTVQRLIEAAILAPSARNEQPWAFVACVDRARIAGYAERAKKYLLDRFASEAHGPAMRHTIEDPKFVLFYGAPALVLVIATSAETQAMEDCCLAAENLMLAAREKGIGSCWIGFSRPWLDLPSTKAELGIPGAYHVVAPIVLGYPKAWPPSHGRRPPEVHWLG